MHFLLLSVVATSSIFSKFIIRRQLVPVSIHTNIFIDTSIFLASKDVMARVSLELG